ncbi:GntP family permease [Bacillus sp. FJAT-44742]|uniref:GntP family permease n=1 Tax=Bacillus sp. FJAT-44742 TaxID=2014005 RepID=UPI000C232C53|nr:SLC13 family permease [Bacillus sp. FJAT-44742]
MNGIEISALGTLLGLGLTIFFIIKKVSPAYAMMIGALFAGIAGGITIEDTVLVMIDGAGGMTGVVLRVLAAGVLAGVLIESGAARTIAEQIFNRLGVSKALLAIAGAMMVLTGVGVFIGVAVLTVAPIALSIAHKANLSKMAVLLAITCGGKAGNIISPNPNTIAVADAFQLPLTTVMFAGIVPALGGIWITYIIARHLQHKGEKVDKKETEKVSTSELPSLTASLSGPAAAIGLLLLQPLFGIAIDPLVALPAGGAIGAFMMKKGKDLNHFAHEGLKRMSGVAILLIGTGTLAGIIAHSELIEIIITGIDQLGMPAYMLAPVAGMSMSVATGSTSAAAAVAGNVFAPSILELGVHPLAGAAMLHAGAGMFDNMPQGTLFHISRAAVDMSLKERFQLLPYEFLVGGVITLISTLLFGVMGHIFLT